jgi:hypothetical protein
MILLMEALQLRLARNEAHGGVNNLVQIIQESFNGNEIITRRYGNEV